MTKYLVACGGEATASNGNGYKVWINRYTVNGATARAPAVLVDVADRPYVERVHNHRFGLASLNAGPEGSGYDAHMFLIDDPDRHEDLGSDTGLEAWSAHISGSTHLVAATFVPGDVWSMRQDEAHSLRNIRSGTTTVVIETASQRSNSVQFNDEGTQAQKIIPGYVDLRGMAFADL